MHWSQTYLWFPPPLIESMRRRGWEGVVVVAGGGDAQFCSVWAVGRWKNNADRSLDAFSVSCVFWGGLSLWSCRAFDTRRRGRGLSAFINIYLITAGQKKEKEIAEERIRRYQLIFIVNWPKSILQEKKSWTTITLFVAWISPSRPSFPPRVLVSDTKLCQLISLLSLGSCNNLLFFIFVFNFVIETTTHTRPTPPPTTTPPPPPTPPPSPPPLLLSVSSNSPNGARSATLMCITRG